ncbi:putative LDG family protein [Candida albicans P76055]|nr:putative LDG family protein [Candida albicans P76055]
MVRVSHSNMKVSVSTMPSSVTVSPNSAMMMNPNICSTQLTLKLATTLVSRETLFNFQSLLHLSLKSVMMVL